MLSSEEVRALDAILDDAIAKSQEDDGDPVFHEVNAKGVNPFADSSIQDRIFDSLAKKGLIQCSGEVDLATDKVLESYVCITPEGLEALKAAKGVH